MHDPASFILHLHLFLGIVIPIGCINERNDIQRDLRCEGFYNGLFTFCDSVHLLLELGKACLPGTGNRLIGAGNHILDGRQLCDPRDSHKGNDGAAVWIGNDAVMLKGIRAVDFWHNQGNIRIKAERRAVVDIDGTALLDRRSKSAGHVTFHSTEDKVHPREAVVRCFLNRNLLAVERNHFSCTSGAAQRQKLFDWDLILLKDLEHFLPDGAGCAKNCNIECFHFFLL